MMFPDDESGARDYIKKSVSDPEVQTKVLDLNKQLFMDEDELTAREREREVQATDLAFERALEQRDTSAQTLVDEMSDNDPKKKEYQEILDNRSGSPPEEGPEAARFTDRFIQSLLKDPQDLRRLKAALRDWRGYPMGNIELSMTDDPFSGGGSYIDYPSGVESIGGKPEGELRYAPTEGKTILRQFPDRRPPMSSSTDPLLKHYARASMKQRRELNNAMAELVKEDGSLGDVQVSKVVEIVRANTPDFKMLRKPIGDKKQNALAKYHYWMGWLTQNAEDALESGQISENQISDYVVGQVQRLLLGHQNEDGQTLDYNHLAGTTTMDSFLASRRNHRMNSENREYDPDTGQFTYPNLTVLDDLPPDMISTWEKRYAKSTAYHNELVTTGQEPGGFTSLSAMQQSDFIEAWVTSLPSALPPPR
jgi:hypothetical protein